MLLATRDSEAAKKPRLRLSMRRSSSVRPPGECHNAISACMDTSVGIQWLLQAARYFSHAQWYFSGNSWLTSARQLIIALSSTVTRPAPRSTVVISLIAFRSCRPRFAPILKLEPTNVRYVGHYLQDRRKGPAGGRVGGLLAGFAVGVVDRAGGAGR